MCVLTGSEILNFISPVLTTKHDDGTVPSYGMDGCLYTFRCEPPEYIDKWVLGQGCSLSVLTRETISMPLDVMGVTYLKSTYSRQGIVLCNGGVIDNGYVGRVSAVLFNGGPRPVTLDFNGGIVQVVFHRMTQAAPGYKGRWM